VFTLLVTTISGIRAVPREYIEVARVFGAPWWERVFRVELPLAAPALLAGLKVGVALSLTGAIVGEFVAADQGLGFLLNYYRENLYTAELFATLIVLAAIGIVLFSLVTALERIVARWQD
jgi:NitT/TauT family transport system permease protein